MKAGDVRWGARKYWTGGYKPDSFTIAGVWEDTGGIFVCDEPRSWICENTDWLTPKQLVKDYPYTSEEEAKAACDKINKAEAAAKENVEANQKKLAYAWSEYSDGYSKSWTGICPECLGQGFGQYLLTCESCGGTGKVQRCLKP